MPQRSAHRITKRSTDALGIGEKEYIVWDRDLPGFGVRVLTTGRKVFVVQARGPGGSKRLSIGRHGDLTAAQARKRASELIRHIKEGSELKWSAPSAEPTVTELAQRYLKSHAAVSCRAQTVESYRMIIDTRIVPALGELKIGSVRRMDVAALHDALHDRPGMANRTVQILAQMFRKAGQWGLIPDGSNPCRGIRKYPLRVRNRYLTKDEYRRLGRALKQTEADGSVSRPATAALRLLILTGCRLSEILTLRWDDVDFSARELRLRDSKTGPCMVALTSAVETVLNGIARIPDNPWVIVSPRRGRHLTSLQPAWEKIKSLAGLDDVRLHDLRHSYASRALALGENLTMIGKLLNHGKIDTTARYSHLMLDAERAAAARIGDAIESQIQQPAEST